MKDYLIVSNDWHLGFPQLWQWGLKEMKPYSLVKINNFQNAYDYVLKIQSNTVTSTLLFCTGKFNIICINFQASAAISVYEFCKLSFIFWSQKPWVLKIYLFHILHCSVLLIKSHHKWHNIYSDYNPNHDYFSLQRRNSLQWRSYITEYTECFMYPSSAMLIFGDQTHTLLEIGFTQRIAFCI